MNETWWTDETELDDDQKEVIKLGLEGNYLITGPPGSGKTNLLLLRAKYIALSDKPNVLIIVFTRTLKEFIASGASTYSFPQSKILTSHSWAHEILRDYGTSIEETGNFETDRLKRIQAINEIIKREGLGPIYDTILLDEAQDYLPEEIEIFQKLGRQFFATADARQQIHRFDSSLDHFDPFINETIPLRVHYRNGPKICSLADEIMQGVGDYHPLFGRSNYDERAKPSKVTVSKCADIETQCEKAISEIDTQLQAYPGEMIGVITPRTVDVGIIGEHFLESAIGEHCLIQDPNEGYSPFHSMHRVCVSTIHGAKGLEFRALHIINANRICGMPNQKRLLYTGITRAKTSLSLYHAAELPGFLEGALARLEPTNRQPEISDIFEEG